LSTGVIANTINIGADIGAMAALPDYYFQFHLCLRTLFTVFVLFLEYSHPIKIRQDIKVVIACLLAYPVTALLRTELAGSF